MLVLARNSVLVTCIQVPGIADYNITSRNAKHCGASLSDERLTI